MKNKVSRILTLFGIGAGLFFCVVLFSVRTHRTAPSDRAKIVVSGYVPYTFVKTLAGDSADILMLLPPSAEPHSFEPTPGVLVQLHEADAFIYVSDLLEPWAADLASAVADKTKVLVLAEGVADSGDPHIWMNLQNAPLLADEIAQLLLQVVPQNQMLIKRNLSKFKEEISALQDAFAASLPFCQNKEAVHIGHLAFGNLLTPYGITLTALSGTSHEGEHSVKKVIELVGRIQQKNIQTIFTEETLSPRLAQVIARETKVQLLPLYPIEHISKQDFDNQVTYGDFMRRNLTSLQRGLQCPAS
jgi:zinc transport system substrate-binding protein